MKIKKLFLLFTFLIMQFNIFVYAETNFQKDYAVEFEQYNKIIALYNEINKDYENKELYSEYITLVETFLKNYGNISLKLKNSNNHFPLIKRLGYAYEKTSNINKAVITYEKLANEYPTKIDISKHLLYLYDTTSSCLNAQNIYKQIQLYEPNYKYTFIYCNQSSSTKYERPISNIGSLNNVQSNNTKNKTPNTSKTALQNENYDWFLVYLTFFSFWIFIFIIAKIVSNSISEDKECNYYQIKYNGKKPIKPNILEFNLNTELYEKIDKMLKCQNNNSKFFVYIIPALSMICVNMIFNAPQLIFPIIFEINGGIIYGLIFYILCLVALASIIDSYERYINKNAIQNYNNYNYAMSLYKEAKERELWEQKDYWKNLSPFEFEEAVGKLFKSLGYTVNITQKSRDGGIDILIEKNNVIKGVQCKHYKSKVGAKEVRELWGVKDYFKLNNKIHKLDGVIMVALSGVSKAGNEFISMFPEYELWTIDTIVSKASNINYQY